VAYSAQSRYPLTDRLKIGMPRKTNDPVPNFLQRFGDWLFMDAGVPISGEKDFHSR
jgi:hypothetical protein